MSLKKFFCFHPCRRKAPHRLDHLRKGTEETGKGFKAKWGLQIGMVLFTCVNLALAKPHERDSLTIKILVYQDSRISRPIVAEATQIAAMIFRQSGINTTWVSCSDSEARESEECREALVPNSFALHVVAHGTTATDHILGTAFLGVNGIGQYCDAFFDRIQDMHQQSQVNVSRLLGTVMAHEVGHLLLGSHGHAMLGIMSPHWQAPELRRIDMGSLGFSPEQGLRMKAHIEQWQVAAGALQLARKGEHH